MTSNIRYKPLPKDLFLVRVPIVATYSEYEMTNLGLPVNIINGQPDMKTYNTMTPVYLDLDRIIDIYINGYPIRLINHDDLDKIYAILDSYVRGLNENNNYELNMVGVVEERLYDIERFAAEIFDENKLSLLKKIINFRNGYDAKVEIMPVQQVNSMGYGFRSSGYYTPASEYNYTDPGTHMSNYSTVLSNNFGDNSGLNTFSGMDTQDEGSHYQNNGSARDAFRFNPNKKTLDNTTYVNNHMPDIDFGSVTRNKTNIRIKNN